MSDMMVNAATAQKLTRTQKLVARRMAEAKREVPEFTAAIDVEMDTAAALRGELKAAASDGVPVPSYNDMIVRACALALRTHPAVNGSFDAEGGTFQLWEHVNVGIAVEAGDRLLVPTVRDADAKSLAEIAQETRALAESVRDKSILPEALADGTFTVSNLGMFGVRHFEAVLNPPQAAILAVGAVRAVAVPRDGAIVAAQQMTLTLTSDHRIIYGADAARFLADVRDRLQDPQGLLG
ncbi:2-oxo acid dehydrogenase subunit E2 [Conexibacter woesei]|uniref:2-oxo acid dehydrogenase subunit E2 n=1 Tax=Conexibacter woesei TaxID=191495 RepID=UPI000429E262|nr:2-oxo acid dehydrogenase subunit E2 [Conexibacter woesei]